ncbi:MAG: GerAB/ArcD/ProY family transporter [Alicyclobacillus sp.]|nr:GerAB/ArcD/ProY family transporter [Alicyclobacillus sp.]
MSSNFRRCPALQVASTYIGTVVGAGFASGQEIWQFFGKFGAAGWVGCLVSVVLFSWLGYKVMCLGSRYAGTSFLDVSRRLFGSAAGWIVNGILWMMLFGITVAMLAGAGELFRERWHVPFQAGAIATVLITFWTIRRGISGVLRANMFIVPVMISFVVFIGMHAVPRFVDGVLHHGSPMQHAPLLKAVVHAIVYSTFNVGLSAGVLIPLGHEIGNLRTLKAGAVLGSVGLALMIAAEIAVLATHPSAVLHQVPMADAAAEFGPWLQMMFVFVLWAEIYSTLVGNVYAMVAQWSHRTGEVQALVTACILVAAFAASHIGFSNLVIYAYAAFGYISAGLLVLLLWPRTA